MSVKSIGLKYIAEKTGHDVIYPIKTEKLGRLYFFMLVGVKENIGTEHYFFKKNMKKYFNY